MTGGFLTHVLHSMYISLVCTGYGDGELDIYCTTTYMQRHVQSPTCPLHMC